MSEINTFFFLFGPCHDHKSLILSRANQEDSRLKADHSVKRPHTTIILSWFSIPLVLKHAGKMKVGLQIKI